MRCQPPIALTISLAPKIAKIPTANINARPHVTLPKNAAIPRKITAIVAIALPVPLVNQSAIPQSVSLNTSLTAVTQMMHQAICVKAKAAQSVRARIWPVEETVWYFVW